MVDVSGTREWKIVVLVILASFYGCSQGNRDTHAERASPQPSWITDEVLDSVSVAIERSEARGEVPIGAACIVGTPHGRRIFIGSNAMRTEAAGHAEIMAIDAALVELGTNRMNPDSIWIVTSLEPCPMCSAAIADIWRIPGDHVGILYTKLAEWRNDEQERIERTVAQMVHTGRDSLQRAAFCRNTNFRSEYPAECE